MEANLAPAAERHARRRGDDREWRILERHVGVLAFFDAHFQHWPHRRVGGKQTEADVGADREVVGVVVDDEGLEAFLVDLGGLLDHLDRA